MVATAPDKSAQGSGEGWLDPFLAEWRPGSGEVWRAEHAFGGRAGPSIFREESVKIRAAKATPRNYGVICGGLGLMV